jgi:hypothetical protein
MSTPAAAPRLQVLIETFPTRAPAGRIEHRRGGAALYSSLRIDGFAERPAAGRIDPGHRAARRERRRGSSSSRCPADRRETGCRHPASARERWPGARRGDGEAAANPTRPDDVDRLTRGVGRRLVHRKSKPRIANGGSAATTTLGQFWRSSRSGGSRRGPCGRSSGGCAGAGPTGRSHSSKAAAAAHRLRQSMSTAPPPPWAYSRQISIGHASLPRFSFSAGRPQLIYLHHFRRGAARGGAGVDLALHRTAAPGALPGGFCYPRSPPNARSPGPRSGRAAA